ncbi:hypothetical protein SAMN05660690_2925 [Geodermatophilus telluris]|uniref:Uncharacterized protein n=1 Tax=Geodermatophilus telluris TaxID=1190417 RepID=A0A1G6QJR1_9ACTN|nr:hypothetical protein SAMN05660690_2925 [Geodermatophilus telluris]
MLSAEEERAWEEIRRRYAREVEEPARRLDPGGRRLRSSTPVALRAAVVAGGGLAVLLVVLGAPLAGLAIAVATVPQWLLWRYWPVLDGGVGPSAPAGTRTLHAPDRPSSEESRGHTPRTA